MPTPAVEKRNAFTQLIDRVGALNAESGAPAGRNYSAISVGAGPSVQTAAMLAQPEPLSDEERAELDSKAVALGIVSEDEVTTPVARQIVREIVDTVVRAPISPSLITERRVLPDFTVVNGYDLIRNVVYIDGMEFPLPLSTVQDLKAHAIEIAVDRLTNELAAALRAFGLPTEAVDATLANLKEGIVNANVTTPVSVREHGDQSGEFESPSVPVPDVPAAEE